MDDTKVCAGREDFRADDRQQESLGGHAVVGKKPHMANGNAASMHTQPTSAAPMSGFKPKYAPTATPDGQQREHHLPQR